MILVGDLVMDLIHTVFGFETYVRSFDPGMLGMRNGNCFITVFFLLSYKRKLKFYLGQTVVFKLPCGWFLTVYQLTA